jgi:PmbA protein
LSGHLPDLALDIVKRARAAGATDAECTISEGDEFSVNIRMREVESLKESGSRAAGLRVLAGKRAGSSYTSDFSPEGIRKMIESAMELARMTTEDPFAGLPEPDELGKIDADLGLYSQDVADLEAPRKMAMAREAEEAALSFDARIVNSEGASFDTHLGRNIFANSRGFLGEYRTSYCSLSAVPVAKAGDQMERDYWHTISRSFGRLEDPAEVGRKAARRALRRLGAAKVATQKVPVVFEPRIARSLLDCIFDAVSGDSIYRQASFLAGKIGQKIASDHVTVIDDGTIPGLFGSFPFDDEGVPTRRTVIIEKGVLRSYLLNTYTARKLGMKTTGSASRGITGNAGIGHGNFYFEKGHRTQEEILRSIRNGFFVTDLMGFGINTVTGDYSQGASGLWIRDGELAFPVSEVTIAGNLNQMLLDVEAVGSDLEFRGSVASPTLAIGEMTVAGR